MRVRQPYKRQSNWLLRGLVVVSLIIHSFIFLHISGIYSSSALTCIELTLQSISKPPTRSIPMPRPRPKSVPERQELKRTRVVTQKMPRLKPIKMERAERALPDSLMERVSMPDIPATLTPQIDHWSPEAFVSQAASGEITSLSYFDMVRLRIEKCKQYPDVAQTKQIEGSVTVRFVLTLDGEVLRAEVTETSKQEVLDEAALRAVKDAAPFPKPPRNVFKGEIPLEVTITFELT